MDAKGKEKTKLLCGYSGMGLHCSNLVYSLIFDPACEILWIYLNNNFQLSLCHMIQTLKPLEKKAFENIVTSIFK